jgi:hypothetical protein
MTKFECMAAARPAPRFSGWRAPAGLALSAWMARGWRWLGGLGGLVLALLLLGGATPALAQNARSANFDHLSTGFPLTGAHLNQRDRKSTR